MGCRLLHLLLVGLALLGAAGTSTAAAQSEGLRGALAEGSSTAALSLDLLAALCNVSSVPAPGSGAEFMGPLRRATTSVTDYGYYRFGNAASGRPPLLLLPGFASTMTAWGVKLLQGLAARQELVVLDFRGQGLSKDLDPTAELSVEGMAADIIEFMNATGLERPNVLGWSLGGMVATAMAALYGPQVGSVVVAAGSAGSRNSFAPAPDVLELSIRQNISALEGATVLFDLSTAQGSAALCSFFLDGLAAVQSPVNKTTNQRQELAIIHYNLGVGVYDLLPGVDNPMLLVGGSEDGLVPPQNLQIMAAELGPKVALWVYPNTRHGVIQQNTDSVLALVEAFLSQYGG